jgi:hypothetical protein
LCSLDWNLEMGLQLPVNQGENSGQKMPYREECAPLPRRKDDEIDVGFKRVTAEREDVVQGLMIYHILDLLQV